MCVYVRDVFECVFRGSQVKDHHYCVFRGKKDELVTLWSSPVSTTISNQIEVVHPITSGHLFFRKAPLFCSVLQKVCNEQSSTFPQFVHFNYPIRVLYKAIEWTVVLIKAHDWVWSSVCLSLTPVRSDPGPTSTCSRWTRGSEVKMHSPLHIIEGYSSGRISGGSRPPMEAESRVQSRREL